MPRVSLDAATVQAHQNLVRANQRLAQAMEHLTSGLRINRASDDPGGLVTSESFISQSDALGPAMEQAQRASNMIATADSALAEISNLLLSIQQLVVEAANEDGLSSQERAANQLQVDAAIDSIRRLAETTSFAGRTILDGSLDYSTSGLDSGQLNHVRVDRVGFGGNDYAPVRIDVSVSAQPGNLLFATSQTTGPVQIQLAGNTGAETFSFASGTTASAVLLAVNQAAGVTGVSATLLNSANPASGIRFSSIGFGSDEFVSVQAVTGAFATTNGSGSPAGRAAGRDIQGSINGQFASGSGRQLTLHSSDMEVAVNLDEGFGVGSTSFVVTGGGALFQIGPSASGSDQAGLAIQSAMPAQLGRGDVGFLSELGTGGAASISDGDMVRADAILHQAIDQVASMRGRLGAFAGHTLDARTDAMQTQLENAQSSASAIRDADFAAEISEMTRAELLNQVAVSILASGNNSRQTILQLLA